MDAAQALAELAELSSQVERAVVLDAQGEVLGSTEADRPDAGQSLAQVARDLVEAAGAFHASAGEVVRAEVELEEGGLFVLSEGGRTIAATTGPGPTAGLVAYDLRTCLHAIETKPKRRRASRKQKEETE